jgi:hypothetical protein
VDLLREVDRAPRVEEEGAIEALGRASELGENEHAVKGHLGGDVFVGDEVHAVAGWGDEEGVWEAIVCKKFGMAEGGVEELDWATALVIGWRDRGERCFVAGNVCGKV